MSHFTTVPSAMLSPSWGMMMSVATEDLVISDA
jgi:hypothetical protein